jgi:hypothetical protein
MSSSAFAPPKASLSHRLERLLNEGHEGLAG